jgi:hypothetical protein
MLIVSACAATKALTDSTSVTARASRTNEIRLNVGKEIALTITVVVAPPNLCVIARAPSRDDFQAAERTRNRRRWRLYMD